MAALIKTKFTSLLGIKTPIICGAMYPCSNPELVAAASEAGGIGIVQPLSLTYVHGYDLKDGLKKIKSLTNKPWGMNIIVESSSKIYEERMLKTVDIALDEGCRFFITALGNPERVVKKVKEKNGVVFHDVTEKKWAEKALLKGVDGLIAVNNRAGGHAGKKSPQELYRELSPFNVPIILAGGIGSPEGFIEALEIGYDGIQMGTRFIATLECSEKQAYKEAIVKAGEKDIVLTERVTGIPLSVINTPYVQKIGLHAGPIARFLLQHRLTKKWMRMWYGLTAVRDFKKISRGGGSSKDYWQAGKSVEAIQSIVSVKEVIDTFTEEAMKKLG